MLITSYKILIFFQLLAYLDDAVKQCRALQIQLFYIKPCQTLSPCLLECLGMLNVLQINSLRVDDNREIWDALRQCPTQRIVQPRV